MMGKADVPELLNTSDLKLNVVVCIQRPVNRSRPPGIVKELTLGSQQNIPKQKVLNLMKVIYFILMSPPLVFTMFPPEEKHSVVLTSPDVDTKTADNVSNLFSSFMPLISSPEENTSSVHKRSDAATAFISNPEEQNCGSAHVTPFTGAPM
jgi:hypothetical protein